MLNPLLPGVKVVTLYRALRSTAGAANPLQLNLERGVQLRKTRNTRKEEIENERVTQP